MKLLTSVLFASAAVEARQRREGHGEDHGDMMENETGDHGDMMGGHGDMTGGHGDMMGGHGDMTGEHGGVDHGDMTTTTEHMMHSTTTPAPHTMHYTTHAHTTHAHTTHAPHTEKPHVEMPKPCEGQRCGCNAEEMMRWKNEMREWKHDQESKLILIWI